MATETSQTLARGLRLLDLIAGRREGLPARELVAASGLPRSIVQRLLTTLEAEGFIERDPGGAGYRLAMKLWSLGCLAIGHLGVRDVARPQLERLAEQTDEVAKLGILDGTEVVYVDRVECRQPVRPYVPVGGRAPAALVATGKAILAFSGSGAGASAAELREIRRRGYAVNRGEWEADVAGVAAPIFDAQGTVVASLGVILPVHRLSAARSAQIGQLTVAAAAEVSRRLGYAPAEALR